MVSLPLNEGFKVVHLLMVSTGAGYDQLDIDACTARNILVSNTPTAVDASTADLAIFLILGSLRNLPVSMTSLRAGNWRGNPLPKLGHDPQGKIIGILGMGGIGRAIAERARVFGMRVRYHNRTKLSEEMEAGSEYVDFETLLRESDILSLSLPLNVSLALCPHGKRNDPPMLIMAAASNTAHHLSQRACPHQTRRCHRQHRPRCHHQRVCARVRPRLGSCCLCWPRRLRRRACRTPRLIEQRQGFARSAHGNMDG